DLRTWQVYGLSLALLVLLWAVVRAALRTVKAAGKLLDAEWPGLDRILAGVLCALQLVVSVGAVFPAIGYELGAGSVVPASLQAAASPAGWWLLATLAAGCIAAAWIRWREPELLAMLALAGTLPWMAAAGLGSPAEAASVLRWAAGAMLAVGTAAICLRQPIAARARSLGIRVETDSAAPQLARATVLGLTLLPILGVTLLAAWARLAGLVPCGPSAGTFFHSLGTQWSYLVPLLLAVASLVILAWRESLGGYAFGAGLVTKLCVVLACLLSFTRWGTDQWGILWYALAIASAAWAAGWVTARRRVDVWREDRPGSNALLMRLELGIGAGAAAMVLVPGLLSLLVPGLSTRGQMSVAAGGWLGWLAFASIVAAALYRQFELRRPVPVDLAGLAGLAFIGLVACTLSGQAGSLGFSAAGWRVGFHAMTIGWAAYSVLIALSTWWMAEHVRLPGAEGPPQVLVRAANVWVIVAGALAALLGLLDATFFDPRDERLWGAAAIGLASAASASMAVWRRREVWAFVSGLGVNVAASFIVSYFESELRPRPAFLLLVQANVIAGALVALAWLAVRKRLYLLHEKGVWSGPLLAVQIALASTGALALVVPAMLLLVAWPGDPPDESLRQIGSAPGTIAVLLAGLAAGLYLFRLRREAVIHVIGLVGMAGGVLLAAASPGWVPGPAGDGWLPCHVLMAAWTGAGLVLLGLAAAVRLAGNTGGGESPALAVLRTVLPEEPARLWHFALTLSAAGVGLLWCTADPDRPWWAAGVMLAGAAGAAGSALWRRRLEDILASGLLLNLAASVAWVAWRGPGLAGLAEANVAALAVGAMVWTALQWFFPARVIDIRLDEQTCSFAELALYLALAVLGGLATVLVGLALAEVGHPGPLPLTWWAVVVVAVALLARLATPSRQFVLPGFYYLGLTAVGLALDARAESARHLVWLAGPELAGCALVAAVIHAGFRRAGLADKKSPDDRTYYGVLAVQAALVVAATTMAVATALDPAFGGLVRASVPWLAPGRWAGPLVMAAVLPAAVLTAQGIPASRARAWQYASLVTAALLVAAAGWAWLPPADVNPLNQAVVLMVAAVFMALAVGTALPRLLREESTWVAAGRTVLAPFAGTAALALAVILVQEAFLFDPQTGAPMATWAVVVVAAAMACLVAGLIAFAVAPHRDPLGLDEQKRTAYVYAAEAVGGLICLHLWLTEPGLFQFGIVEQYWMLIVIALAFAGIGLSEWFHRIGLPVLAEPLANTAALLPLAPAIGYWIPTGVVPASALAGSSPAVWFCGSVFYALMAVTRRSTFFSFLALGTLAASFCLLWEKMELGLSEHVQLYGIPIGIAILLAEQIHHRELKSSVASAMRYIALSCIYLTSSAEFLWELGETVWLPLTLIGLSILGILAGVFLRLRSFVIVGFTSLALVLGALVYHAAVDQRRIWVFALAMFALGVPLLAFFMVFEKKKAQILAAVNRFWNWERRDLVPQRDLDRPGR
ncbi:MAG: hypothetical protein ACYC6Y_07035, partial [Thermoguttaceae bacterium]